MKKWLRWTLLGLLAVVLVTPTVLMYAIVSSQWGLRFIASHLGQMGPVTVTVENVSGTLSGGFTVGSLRVTHRRADVRITDASGQLRLLPLLQRRIELSRGQAGNVTVQVFKVTPRSGRSQNKLRFMAPTLMVTADALHADSSDLILMNGNTLHATDISITRAEVLPDVIRVRDAVLDWQEMHLTADGRIQASDPIGIDGRASSYWRPKGQPAWRFDTTFDGDLDKLPLELDVSAPFHAHLKGQANDLTSKWSVTGDATTRDLDINVFGGGTALGIISAQVAVGVDTNGFWAKGPVTAPGLKAGPIQVDFRGAYDDKRLTIRPSTAVHRPSGSRGTMQGTVDVVENGPRLALAGEWTTLRWPLEASEPAFTSPHGRYTLEGLKPWKARAEGEIAAAGISGMPATVTGDLGTEIFTIQDGTIGVYGGTARVTGEARWKPAESWKVTGRMTGMDVGQVREDLPGRVEFDFSASGAPFGGAGSIDFAMSKLTGKLRDMTASGSGRLEKPAGSENWKFHQVDVRLGRARLQLDGSLAEPRDLRFAIDADDLSLIDANARGRLSARGRWAGTDEAPLLLFKARGADFQWQDYRVDAIDADVDVDLQDTGRTQGKIDLTGIGIGARSMRAASLELSGTGRAQQVALSVDTEQMRGTLTADGAMQDGLWRGNVTSLTVNDDAQLALRLRQPAPIAAYIDQLELGDLCLVGDEASGCINGKRQPDGRWNAVFSIQNMPLRAFTAGLSQTMDYEGTINLGGELAGSSSGIPTGSVTGELTQAQLIHLLGNDERERLSLGSGTIQATATATGFSAQVSLDAGASGSIKGSLTGQRNTQAWRDYPVRGELQAHTDGLSMLDMYVGGIDKATGRLSTDVDIKGTLGNPLIEGRLQLRDASIDIYQVGTSLRELSLDARFDAQSLDLTGKSRMGSGVADFSGKLSWRDGEPYGNLHIDSNGQRLRVVDVPEARIEASPDLDFRIDGRRIDVTGEVRIPRATLEPADLANVVLASDDEQLVGAQPVDPEQRWIVTSNITMVLGDDVNIDALGLTAQLGGSVNVRTDAAGNDRGTGELNIKSGKFTAVGRQLDIERGRLIYRNVPLNDPGVDLRAQKEFPDVIAGVNVRGTLRTQQLSFFSEPQLPQLQIASLILAGGSLESVQNSQRSGAALNELLTQGGGILVQRVGSRVGVDDIGVESDFSADAAGGTSSSSSLVLGKYLTPRLYVSYGISLTEAIDTFKMRWTIGKGWTVKTEAGKARSADIVYTFKKGAKKAEQK